MKLYEIAEDYVRLLTLAESEDMDEEALKDTFEGLDGEFEMKADGYAKVLAELTSDIDKIKAEIDRLTARKKVIENNVTRMKDMLKAAMEATGKVNFKTDLYTFKVVNNGGAQPVKIIGDVPSEFTKTKIEISNDMEKIRAYLAEHGDTKWAELQERGRRLSIK